MLFLMIGAALAMGGTAGYYVGVAMASRAFSTSLQTDREAGRRLLELLAQRWGARLELFQVPGSDPSPPPPS